VRALRRALRPRREGGPLSRLAAPRLESIGQRAINNVVDATNFVLWEMGHPLHPFDLDRLGAGGSSSGARDPASGLTTLDGAAEGADIGTCW